jgi:hypothetical protein
VLVTVRMVAKVGAWGPGTVRRLADHAAERLIAEGRAEPFKAGKAKPRSSPRKRSARKK